MSEAVLREGSIDDAKAISALLGRVFPDNAKSDEEILHWQYFGGPYGKPVIVVLEADGAIVGHYTSVRYPAKVEGEPTQVGIGIDAAIAPSHQGQRLFGPLASALYAATGRAGMPLTVCYPNENSVKGIARVGWQECGLLRTHLLPLDSGWYAERLRLPRAVVGVGHLALSAHLPTFGYVVSESRGPDPEVDSVWKSVEPRVRNGVVRDFSWFRWRYGERPGGAYRYFSVRRRGSLCGVAVSAVRQQRGADFVYLLELMASSAGAARALVHAIADDARGAAGIVLATLPATSTSELAKRAGLWLVPARFEEKPLHFGAVDNLGAFGALRGWSWTLGWGDLDHL